uniref:Ribonuclease E n=1 Tax=Polysiphonia sertularioides TaxID=945028 RepID=A0A1Z1M937_9FLOR|nr:ribonuclease E [Polysiphonia sertularioides]ARW62412.1 ribonuclease E [Polysiphonia sertularioides]
MVKKIIISYFNSIAVLLQGTKVQQIILVNKEYQLNDIYIGKVHKIFSSINAAFITLGYGNRSGFIHISDIKGIKKNVKFFQIADILSVNQLILVQIIKEPTLSKGPRLTTNIHLHGKYIVLMPLCNLICISNRIDDPKERSYLSSLAILIKPKSMGLLFKLTASGVSESLILHDLDFLVKQWFFIQKKIVLTNLPAILYKDEDIVRKVMRDVYDKDVGKIIVDSKDFLNLVYFYLKRWFYISQSIKTKLYFYDKKVCILDRFLIKHAIKNALKPKITLCHGGYLFVETYEALTVIDVNSGSFNKLNSSKDTVLRINFYAAIEIAYQLRLRNISGVIIIDFIDMSSQRDKLKLIDYFNTLIISDECSSQIVEFSELGLLQLTRRRKYKSLFEFFKLIPFKEVGFFHEQSLIDTYFNYFSNSFGDYLNTRYLVRKNVHYLFSNKVFMQKRALRNKFSSLSYSMSRKYLNSCDKAKELRFLYPKANFIVPLGSYIRLIKYSNKSIIGNHFS